MNSKRKDLEKGFYVKYIVATFCLVLIFAITIGHSKYMDQKISDISKVYLSKMTLQNASIISSQIQGNLQTVNVLARMIGNQDEINMPEILGILNNEIKSSDLISMGVVFKDRNCAFTPISMNGRDGSELLISSDWEYINKTMTGNLDLQGSSARLVNGKMMTVYARPIYHNLEISGALVILFNNELFYKLDFPETFDQDTCSYLADKNGTIIFHPKSSPDEKQYADILHSLATGWSLEGKAGKTLKKDIQSGQSGTIEYTQEKVYVSYVPIGFRDWYLINITPSSMAEAQPQSFYGDIIPAFIYILLILITVTIYYIYIRNENFKLLERKMKIQSISDESYRMIMEQTDDIIFEYNPMDKTYFHIANFKKNFGYEPTKTGFLGTLECDYIHPDDMVLFASMYEKMKEDRSLAECEVRIINSKGEYLWTRIYMLSVFDQDEQLAKVIGKIVNIDDKKKEILSLKEMAVTDSATGVYNKQTTEDMIDAFLKGEGKHGRHAMLIIDIDDFKGVNDDHGHRLGDAVIAALGLELNHVFRTSDIKGRIGGDEFMILMKDIGGIDFIESKARHICKIFKDRDIDKNKKVEVSTSIGIAIYDQDGSTYEELYEAADKALYRCKSLQKGTFKFYSKTE